MPSQGCFAYLVPLFPAAVACRPISFSKDLKGTIPESKSPSRSASGRLHCRPMLVSGEQLLVYGQLIDHKTTKSPRLICWQPPCCLHLISRVLTLIQPLTFSDKSLGQRLQLLQTRGHGVSFKHQSTYSLLQFLRFAHVEVGKVCANMQKIDRTLLQSETLDHPFISSTASIWNYHWNVV